MTAASSTELDSAISSELSTKLTSEQIDKLNGFLHYARHDRDPSVLIIQNPAELDTARMELERKGITVSSDWERILECLETYTPCALELSAPIDRHLYDLVAQYHRRAGMIQLMEHSTLTLRTVQFIPRRSNLLVLVSRPDLQQIEEQYPIMNEVGITEIM